MEVTAPQSVVDKCQGVTEGQGWGRGDQTKHIQAGLFMRVNPVNFAGKSNQLD